MTRLLIRRPSVVRSTFLQCNDVYPEGQHKSRGKRNNADDSSGQRFRKKHQVTADSQDNDADDDGPCSSRSHESSLSPL